MTEPAPMYVFYVSHHGEERRKGTPRAQHSCGYFADENQHLKMVEVFAYSCSYAENIEPQLYAGKLDRELFQNATITLLQYKDVWRDNWTWDLEIHTDSSFFICNILQKALEIFKENNDKNRIIIGQGYSNTFREIWAKEETND